MLKGNAIPVMILIADDDEDDRLLSKQALEEAHLSNDVRFVEDGEELMEYLRRLGRYAGQDGKAPRPGLILLDLNMPKKDGRECLREIKSDDELRDIPIVVLSTSREDEDIARSYQLGVNSFISKPVTFTGLVDALKVMGQYWFELVELPPTRASGRSV
jgi:two-component system, response regulator